jgi:hypothetical protein
VKCEGNSQMKRTKLMSLESEFKNFCIQEGDTIENMYSRLMHILNELMKLKNPCLTLRL